MPKRNNAKRERPSSPSSHAAHVVRAVRYLNALLKEDPVCVSKLFDKCDTTESDKLRKSRLVSLESYCGQELLTVLNVLNGVLRAQQADTSIQRDRIGVLFESSGSMRIKKFVILNKEKTCPKPKQTKAKRTGKESLKARPLKKSKPSSRKRSSVR